MIVMLAIGENIPAAKVEFNDAIGFRAVLLSPMDRSKILGNSRFEIRISRPYTVMICSACRIDNV